MPSSDSDSDHDEKDENHHHDEQDETKMAILDQTPIGDEMFLTEEDEAVRTLCPTLWRHTHRILARHKLYENLKPTIYRKQIGYRRYRDRCALKCCGLLPMDVDAPRDLRSRVSSETIRLILKDQPHVKFLPKLTREQLAALPPAPSRNNITSTVRASASAARRRQLRVQFAQQEKKKEKQQQHGHGKGEEKTEKKDKSYMWEDTTSPLAALSAAVHKSRSPKRPRDDETDQTSNKKLSSPTKILHRPHSSIYISIPIPESTSSPTTIHGYEISDVYRLMGLIYSFVQQDTRDLPWEYFASQHRNITSCSWTPMECAMIWDIMTHHNQQSIHESTHVSIRDEIRRCEKPMQQQYQIHVPFHHLFTTMSSCGMTLDEEGHVIQPT